MPESLADLSSLYAMVRICKEDRFNVGVKDVNFFLMLKCLEAKMFFSITKAPCLANPCCDVSVCNPLLVDNTSQVDKELHLSDGFSTDSDWCGDSGGDLITSAFSLLILYVKQIQYQF
jgi:hypothetical protein